MPSLPSRIFVEWPRAKPAGGYGLAELNWPQKRVPTVPRNRGTVEAAMGDKPGRITLVSTTPPDLLSIPRSSSGIDQRIIAKSLAERGIWMGYELPPKNIPIDDLL